MNPSTGAGTSLCPPAGAGLLPAPVVATIADTLRRGAAVRIAVNGRSMEPVLQDQDQVEATAPGRNEPEPGDVVLADMGGWIVVHRLVGLRGGLSVLTGDGCPGASEVPRAQVLGIARLVRGGRRGWRPLKGLLFDRLARLALRCRPGRASQGGWAPRFLRILARLPRPWSPDTR